MATNALPQSGSIAPLIAPPENSTAAPDSYIVVFKARFRASNFSSKAHDSKQDDPAQKDASSNNGDIWGDITKGIKHTFDLGSFQGVAGRFQADALAEIRRHPAVAFVESDTVGQRIDDPSSKTREHRSWGLAPSTTPVAAAAAAQTGILDTRSTRIYLYESRDGRIITVSAADAVVTHEHQDPSTDPVEDHTSSSRTFELAKDTPLVRVSTLGSNGDETVSDFIAVIDYIVKNHLRRKDGDEKGGDSESVLSVPFAFGQSQAMVLAVTKAIETVLLASSSAAASPIHRSSGTSSSSSDSYIVAFKEGVSAKDFSARIRGFGMRGSSSTGSQSTFRGRARNDAWDDIAGGINHVFDVDTFQGIARHFQPDALDEIRRNVDVAYVEQDSIGHLTEIRTLEDSPWELARISRRRALTREDRDKSKFSYTYDSHGGQGVTVFVIDTGINLDHREFEGKADRTYGVAKEARLAAVKLIGENLDGKASDIIARIEYILKQHRRMNAEQGSNYRDSVASISLVYSRTKAIDTVIRHSFLSPPRRFTPESGYQRS
ncbi:serine protease [Mortierella sp. NVP41]|nr:serine protease [Mortierella sp. NVP41]